MIQYLKYQLEVIQVHPHSSPNDYGEYDEEKRSKFDKKIQRINERRELHPIKPTANFKAATCQ